MESKEQMFISALNELSEAIVIYDENDDFVFCNDANHKLYPHLSPLYKHGNNLRDILFLAYEKGQWNTDVGNAESFVDNRIQQHWLPFHESEQQMDDGRWLLVRNRRMDNGIFIGMRTDISDLKHHASQLEEAHRVAAAADRAKSEFLANMSHEIRTPMNGVMGMAELLASTDLDPRQKMFTDVIVKSGAALLTIINDILDFSKIDAGQMELDPAPFKLAEAIEDVATLVSSKVAEKDLELIVRVDPDLPTMLVGDVGRIRQIVTNLLGNAVKFTEAGHVFVDVNGTPSGELVDGEPVYDLSFRVQDTGVGIAPEKQAKVFDKFSQVDTSATRKHEGTGLGLAITSALIELMRGEIGVESEVGKGSTFWFKIPLAASREVPTEVVIPRDVTGARILIVDDNEVNRAILMEQMTAWKFESAAVADGHEAIAFIRAAQQHNITLDAVVLDYHMPGMNGGDVVKAMRADNSINDVPIIMLTSVDQTEDGKAFSSLGIQGHLTKPARSSLLLETIIAVLQASEFKRAMNESAPAITSQDHASATPSVSPAVEQNSVVPEVQMEQLDPLAESGTVDTEGRIDILVCEDNEVNQIVFSQILQSSGYTFEIANNGKEGLALYKTKSPKLILMDVSMPTMNGLVATQTIRTIEQQRDKGQHIPIIGVTAHAIKGDMEKCLEAGMDDYLSKPVSPDALREKIAKWMQRNQTQVA